MIHNIVKTVTAAVLLASAIETSATEIVVDLNLPKIDASPYHRPYVAVWLETTKREGVYTLAFWHEQEEWFKDARQWWRKLGRNHDFSVEDSDGITSATKKPGKHRVVFNSDKSNNPLAPGQYYLNVEAVREEGGREFLRSKITVGQSDTQTYRLQGKNELGDITITVKNNH